MDMQDSVSLIIVADKAHQKYANSLSQLISLKDDEDGKIIGVVDGSIKSSVWSEKDYLANKVKLPSSTIVIFIGDSKAIGNETTNIPKKFYKYGMTYGWFGTKAFLRVTDWFHSGLFTKEKYKEFLEYSTAKEREVYTDSLNNDIEMVKTLDKFGKAVKDVVYVNNLQYNCLTTVFYLDGLKVFIEEQHGRV